MIIDFIQAHWIQWLFAAICAFLAWGHRTIATKLSEEQRKNEAISQGVQALLRESIVSSYNKYSAKGFCPIYAKESLKRCFTAYKNLGGNDVASELYRKILAMPEEGEEHEQSMAQGSRH